MVQAQGSECEGVPGTRKNRLGTRLPHLGLACLSHKHPMLVLPGSQCLCTEGPQTGTRIHRHVVTYLRS